MSKPAFDIVMYEMMLHKQLGSYGDATSIGTVRNTGQAKPDKFFKENGFTQQIFVHFWKGKQLNDFPLS